MINEYFIRRNAIAAATTLTPNEQEENYPAASVLNRYHFKWWRVSGDEAILDLSWATPETLRELLIRFHVPRLLVDKFHNFGSNDWVKIELSDVAPGDDDVHTSGQIPLNVDDLGYSNMRLVQDFEALHCRITVKAPDLIAAGDLLEIEEIHLGAPWSPPMNPDQGFSEEEQNETDFDIGEYSGSAVGEPRARWDEFERTWGLLTAAQAAEFRRFKRTHGTHRTFVYVADANSPELRQPMIARFTKAPNMTDMGGGKYEVSATIVENR